ncbi:hypothetical protein B0T19DRAFT_429857 [Cercophora scortea]|uniref:Transmembrane protein n=1 Tax=Cercophora scortea TaxID=314031 RepID=A0AAE0I8R8_9PEZI|nr:hypothetical protein B0T19DRAFT_429857 [Cercophora scortea]
MFPTLMRRMAQAAKSDLASSVSSASSSSATTAPANGYTYRLKKVWPPEFHKLSPQAQLRFEKRFKRRVQHIGRRPRWNKMVQLAQFFTITCIPSPFFLLLFSQCVAYSGCLLTTIPFTFCAVSRRGVQRTLHGLEGGEAAIRRDPSGNVEDARVRPGGKEGGRGEKMRLRFFFWSGNFCLYKRLLYHGVTLYMDGDEIVSLIFLVFWALDIPLAMAWMGRFLPFFRERNGQ